MTPSTPWVPWRQALERAGTFEALRPHLHAGRILARHGGSYYWPSGDAQGGPGNVAPSWWGNARQDLDSGRVIFTMSLIAPMSKDAPGASFDIFAIGIELEAESVERSFPVVTELTPAAIEPAPAEPEPAPQPTATEPTPQPAEPEPTPQRTKRRTKRPHPHRAVIMEHYRELLARDVPKAAEETATWVKDEVKSGRLQKTVHHDTIRTWDREDRGEKGRINPD